MPITNQRVRPFTNNSYNSIITTSKQSTPVVPRFAPGRYTLDVKRLPPKQLNIVSFKLVAVSKARVVAKAPPVTVDLRAIMPLVYDQGSLGSCTANALCAAFAVDHAGFTGSRLFLYYNERVLENTVYFDSGATLADGVVCLQKYGVCPETMWSYNTTKFAQKPPPTCYTNALKNRISGGYHIANDMTAMKSCLACGFPFVVGIAVYESFEARSVALTGRVPMPSPQEQLLGGHAVLCVGYDDRQKYWIMRNSWSASWGDRGYFYLPYQYLLNSSLSSDMWYIKK